MSSTRSPRGLEGRPLGSPWGLPIFQCDVFNIREWILNLISSRVIADIVSQAGFVGCIEDNQIHSILAHWRQVPILTTQASTD